MKFTKASAPLKGTVTIPAKAKVDGVSYRVTSIADNAFKNNKKITNKIYKIKCKFIEGNSLRKI